MKKVMIGIFATGLMVASCDSNTTKEEVNVDSTVTEAVAVMEEEPVNELAFNGVTKGAYTLYGLEDVDATGAVNIEEMMTQFDNTGSFEGKVAVDINEVCQKAGCWINFKKSADENIMVFFRDHFTIPIETSAGKAAILYGNLVTDTLTVDFQKHLLDDAAQAGDEINQADYDAITEDKIDLSFDCLSILIKD
ncbi:hypothetical protein DNU06_14560 [Putridiphycobacter roseus]|uniref:DUF4920 domain-containing protein n=1 Tax=Putridiphycobacter roseus TaxID=2219161 RepID=A0A2W1MZW9_9FLAO|nr:DUF4920 domain-containing protein [Putridiphycobacter roseus]PZE16181.1 hypothetical protein DNU06_14560 [Putridiphycobacter roseus]